MSQQEISLARRIIQANEHLRLICLAYYRKEIGKEEFRASRSQILKFIDEAGKQVTPSPCLHADGKISKSDNDITGTHAAITI